MNGYTYDFEVQTMSTVLINALSDILIKRFNATKDSRDQIMTRVVYAPKQRVLLDLLDKDQNLQLPVVSVSIGGMSRDESRVFNKLLGTYYTAPGKTSSIHEKGVLPVNVTFVVSIMTRFQQDIDQILSHLLPYTNPYFIISWRTPKRPDHEIRSKVMWDGNANIQYPVELNANQVARVVADLNFTFQGWLFQNQEEVENIYTFTANIINTGNNSYDTLLQTDKAALSGLDTVAVDTVYYTAVPPKPRFVDPEVAQLNQQQWFTVWGTGFDLITNVYLSGQPVQTTSTVQNPFASSSSLSADNPSFFAMKLLSSDWTYDRFNNSMTFKCPALSAAGNIDLILENVKGYGKLTDNVPVNTLNPYPENSPMYNNWVYNQLPYLSGIPVI